MEHLFLLFDSVSGHFTSPYDDILQIALIDQDTYNTVIGFKASLADHRVSRLDLADVLFRRGISVVEDFLVETAHRKLHVIVVEGD
ncbi:hypothetical protein D3C85_1582670 [compost metagenome]